MSKKEHIVSFYYGKGSFEKLMKKLVYRKPEGLSIYVVYDLSDSLSIMLNVSL